MSNNKIAFIWMVNTPDRLIGIHSTLYFINKSKYRNEIDIWFAASTSELQEQIQRVLKTSTQPMHNVAILNVHDNSWHGYKKKLANIIKNYDYFIKCDDDLFYSHHVLDYLLDHRDRLEDSNTLWLFPTSSINSLTTDLFITDFVLDGTVREQIYADFGSFNYVQYPDHNGTDDLRHLKQFFMQQRGVWNSDGLRDYMWRSSYFNGGEHPIRHSNPAITKLNTYIIENISRIFETTKFSLEPISGFYQAQFYLMRSDQWFYVQSLVEQGTIRQGLIDETEINWFVKYHGKTALIARNAFVIHPALQGVDLNFYHSMIYRKIQEYIGA